MKIAPALGVIVLTISISSPGLSVPAPRLRAHTIDMLVPLPLPFDEQANAGTAVVAARATAKASHKLLLIDFGANWCPDCRVLGGVMEQPEMRAFLQQHYEIVMVDVGRFNRNTQLPAHYRTRLEEIPAVFIVDPRTDRLVNRQSTLALADARTMTPQGVADWLAEWVK